MRFTKDLCGGPRRTASILMGGGGWGEEGEGGEGEIRHSNTRLAKKQPDVKEHFCFFFFVVMVPPCEALVFVPFVAEFRSIRLWISIRSPACTKWSASHLSACKKLRHAPWSPSIPSKRIVMEYHCASSSNISEPYIFKHKRFQSSQTPKLQASKTPKLQNSTTLEK